MTASPVLAAAATTFDKSGFTRDYLTQNPQGAAIVGGTVIALIAVIHIRKGKAPRICAAAMAIAAIVLAGTVVGQWVRDRLNDAAGSVDQYAPGGGGVALLGIIVIMAFLVFWDIKDGQIDSRRTYGLTFLLPLMLPVIQLDALWSFVRFIGIIIGHFAKSLAGADASWTTVAVVGGIVAAIWWLSTKMRRRA